MDSVALGALSLALGLGLLIGLQRERAGSAVGGIRTFPLIALLGAICGLLASDWGGSIVVAGFIGVTSIVVFTNLGTINWPINPLGMAGFAFIASWLSTMTVNQIWHN